MNNLRKNPHIYEINLITWLDELSRREQRTISLRNIPRSEWTNFRKVGIDLIWLMGMWQRSPYSREKARGEPALVEACSNILENFQTDDIVGSPYAVYDYIPDSRFGSFADLFALKKVMEEEGLYLILDFVPNHMACDHPWLGDHPERFIQGELNREGGCREGFFLFTNPDNKRCVAHGRDPNFPAWNDTAQINYGSDDTMEAMAGILSRLAAYCHGFRCDMAMLLLKDVFGSTWGSHLKDESSIKEFWHFSIGRLKRAERSNLLLAEVYWGMETPLFNFGFDYAYDKHLYDLMLRGDIEGVKTCLSTPIVHQEKMIRFLENHDEQRALEAFGSERIKSAMVIHATLPGMRLWHHGQIDGYRVKVPVQLARGPCEISDNDLKSFATNLMIEVNHPVFHEGSFEICETHGWPDNSSHVHLLAWCWRRDDERRLIVINFSSTSAQGVVTLPSTWLPIDKQFICRDSLNKKCFYRSSVEVQKNGLFVALEMGGFHFFKIK